MEVLLVDNPYVLKPDIRYSVNTSGGRSSAYLARHVQLANPNHKKLTFIFANTGMEHTSTYKFIQKMIDIWGLPIYTVEYLPEPPYYKKYSPEEFCNVNKTGKPFDDLIVKKDFLPNVYMRLCTNELKIKSVHKYFEGDIYLRMLGMRYDEQHRMKEDCSYPLVDAKVTKDIVRQYWKEQLFDLELPYSGKETMLGNCQLCFLKSKKQLIAEMIELRKQDKQWVIEWWKDAENLIDRTIKKKVYIRKEDSYADLEKYSIMQEEQLKALFEDPDPKNTGCCYCYDDA